MTRGTKANHLTGRPRDAPLRRSPDKSRRVINICPEISAKLQGSFRFALRRRISVNLQLLWISRESERSAGRNLPIARRHESFLLLATHFAISSHVPHA